MKLHAKSAMLSLVFMFSMCASANDSTARVGAGGLELLRTDDIQMVSEVLEISTSKIRVKYRFLNTSDHDIKIAVAFPMPAFNVSGVVDGKNSRPLDSFHSYVDGKPVKVNKNRVYLIDKVDVTDKLRKIGLSDTQIFDPKFTCTYWAEDTIDTPNAASVCGLTAEQLSAIERQGLAGGEIQETAYWEQTFPAGKEIEVTHEYKPFTGHGAHNHLYLTKFKDAKKQFAEVCLDESTYRLMKPVSDGSVQDEDGNIGIYYLDVEYILGTGRNWKGPIKNFKLVLTKEDPKDVVSLCFPGKPKKTSPTTVEFSQGDYMPQDKLVIYFFQRH